MKVLAFDQATCVTGYAVVEDGKLVRHGTIKIKASISMMERTYAMSDQIASLIEQCTPDEVWFEDVERVNNNVRAEICLARLQGMCLSRSRSLGHTANLIDASTWRSASGIKVGRGVNRTALKEQAIDLVSRLYGVQCGDDEAEAICIAFVVFNKSLDSKENKGNV